MSYYNHNKFVGTNIEFKAFLQGRESIRATIIELLHEAPLDPDGYAIVNVQKMINLLGETYDNK